MAFVERGRGEFGARTPVEHRETKQVTPITEVGIVVAQSRHVSLALILFLASLLVAPPVFGDGVFWVVTAIIAAASFLWFLRQASTTSYTRSDGEVVGVAPEEVVAGLALALLCGFVAWSLQRVMGLLGLSVSWPYDWLRGMMRVIALLAIPASLSYWVHLELRFSQEMAFGSGFLEQAAGALLTQAEPPWYVGRLQRHQADPLPQSPVTRVEWVERRDSGNLCRTAQMILPLPEEKVQALARHVLGGSAFSEPGTKSILSRAEFVKIRDWAGAPARGFVREAAEGKPRQGVVWTAKGKALLRGFAPEYQKPPPPHQSTDYSQARETLEANERTNERNRRDSDERWD